MMTEPEFFFGDSCEPHFIRTALQPQVSWKMSIERLCLWAHSALLSHYDGGEIGHYIGDFCEPYIIYVN